MSRTLCLCLAIAAPCLVLAAPGVSIDVFIGDLADQRFVTLPGELEEVSREGDTSHWRARLTQPAEPPLDIAFDATCIERNGLQRWSYTVGNRQAGTTVCGVTFPILSSVRIGPSWEGNRVYWPSMYQGTVIDDLTSAESFEAQCKRSCKGVPHLYGKYQGDLCLPFFAHSGPDGRLSVTVRDGSHEVFTFLGYRRDEGMEYRVGTHPRVVAGGQWSFGDIEVWRSEDPDWHPVADRYRDWLVGQGFGPGPERRGDIVTMTYGRWGELRAEEAIRWAKAYDARDVLLWVILYGRGDQYYPCYFRRHRWALRA